MLDSFPSSASTASDFGAPSARTGAPDKSHGASGQANGPAAIEIFTSFRALVDALAGDAEGSSASGSKEASPTEGAPPAESKDGHDERIVMPLDIAALLLPHFVVTKVGANAGAALEGPLTSLDHGDAASAHDIAMMLLGTRGVSTDVFNALGDDALNGDDTAGLPLGPLAAAAARAGSEADGAALAQAVIQRLLAAAAAGPQKLAGELTASTGARPQTALDDIVRQIVMQADQGNSGVTSSARLIAGHASDLTASAARSFAAETVASTSALLEAPSTTTADQIVQTIRMQWARGGGEAHIRLEPQQFGDLTVSVRVDQGQVVARLSADTPVIREWLQANQQLLRQSLAEHNLTLSKLEVSEPGNEPRHGTSRNSQEQASREGKPARRPKSPDTGETFEILA